MYGKIFTTRLYYRVCCFVLFLVAASASFNGFYQQSHFAEAGFPGANFRSNFESMVDGTAYRPYVYRQLLPSAANWLNRVVPETVKARLYNRQGTYPNAFLDAIAVSATARNKVYFFRYLVIYIATLLFAVLAVYAMYLVCTALQMPSFVAVLAPVVIILLVPYGISGRGYFYDYPELAFMALAFWVALKFDWWWLVPVVALGTWNKESFLVFVLTLYPIFRLRSSRLGAMIQVGALCLVSLAVYFPLRLAFSHNPGATVYLGFWDQLQMLMNPREMIYGTCEIYGLPMLAGYTILPMALLAWTVWRGWRHLPGAIQKHGLIAAAINFPLYILFVAPGELRDLSMLYMAFLILLAANLNHWIVAPERGRVQIASRAGLESSSFSHSNPIRHAVSTRMENSAGKSSDTGLACALEQQR